ncbi:MAG: hypothetical protein Ct9H300mP11_08810 [Chloroflexota bacterium]|nr:MAG: hypothetical protein Ct9H300mP11_08810 [Chloroflexota bacterium]
MTKSRHIPLRSCIACGLKIPKRQLIRIVNTEQSSVTVDIVGREPGRGAYVCRSPNCWGQVFEKGILDRTFKQRISTKDLEPIRTYYQENVARQDS